MKKDGTGVHGRKLQVYFNSSALRTIWNGNTAVGVEYVQNGVTKQVYARKGVIVCAGLRSSPFLMYSGVGPAALLTSLGIPVIYNNPNVGQGLTDQPHVVTLYTQILLTQLLAETLSFLRSHGYLLLAATPPHVKCDSPLSMWFLALP